MMMKDFKHPMCEECVYFTPSKCADGPSPDDKRCIQTALFRLDEEQFAELLAEHLDNYVIAKELFRIPGVYELLADYYNDVIIDEWVEYVIYKE